MLDGQLDLINGVIPSLIPTYEANPDILVRNVTDDTGIPSLSYYYLCFNNHLINSTWRKAISYAINYSYIIESMQGNRVVRANSPISPGYGERFNSSVKAANYNLTYARQILIDAGITSLAIDDDVGWDAANLASFEYFYYYASSFSSDLYVPLRNWLNEIGITIIAYKWNPGDPENPYLEPNYDIIGLFFGAWWPDYLDPFNMINPLFNPLSPAFSAHINDTWLNTQLTLALKTTNDDSRNEIYKNIQWYLADSLYPHAFCYHLKIFGVQAADLHGVSYNAFGKFEAYGIWRA